MNIFNLILLEIDWGKTTALLLLIGVGLMAFINWLSSNSKSDSDQYISYHDSSNSGLEQKSELIPESKSEPKPKAKRTPKPTPKSEPSPEPVPTPKPKAKPTPKPTQKSEPSPEPVPIPKPKAKPTPKPTQKSEPSPEPVPTPKPIKKSEPSLESLPSLKPNPTQKPDPIFETKPTTLPDLNEGDYVFVTYSLWEPIEGFSFGIKEMGRLGYYYYSIFRYYPTNRYPKGTLFNQHEKAREFVWDFKPGRLSVEFSAGLFASALINQFGTSLKGRTLLIIPASTEEKTYLRFEDFCDFLSLYTGMLNGFSMLTNNNISRDAAHLSGERKENLVEGWQLNGHFKDKDFVVVDDVRTSGNSSNQVYNLLKRLGAKSVVFAYLGRTALNDDPIRDKTNNHNMALLKVKIDEVPIQNSLTSSYDDNDDDLPF